MTTSTDQWVGVDAARPISRDDEPTYKHLDEAIRELEHLRDSCGGITKEIRECEAGRPSSAVPWCLTHSQASSRCIGRGCDVAAPPGHSDPTGDTALTRDRAREHRRDFLHALIQDYALARDPATAGRKRGLKDTLGGLFKR